MKGVDPDVPSDDDPLVLDAALEQLRLDGAIFFRSELTEPFAFESQPLAMAEALHPGADRLILRRSTGEPSPSSRRTRSCRARSSTSGSVSGSVLRRSDT